MPGLWGAGNRTESMLLHRAWSIFGVGEDQASKFVSIDEKSAETCWYDIVISGWGKRGHNAKGMPRRPAGSDLRNSGTGNRIFKVQKSKISNSLRFTQDLRTTFLATPRSKGGRRGREQRRERSFRAGGVARNTVRKSCVNLSEFEIFDF